MRQLLALFALSVAAIAEGPRAKPPEFTDEDRAAFFEDGFATLVGERPSAASSEDGLSKPAGSPEKVAAADWSDLIDPDVIETEIKRQARSLAMKTRSASAFKAGGYRQASDALGVIAAMFAITAEHTGQPRWRDTAAGFRTFFAKAQDATDDSTDRAYKIASRCSADLEDLVRGGRPAAPEPGELDWSEVASRSAIMRRMQEAEGEKLRQWVASPRDLRRNSEDVVHEAQVLAALAEALVQPEAYEFDDEDYQALSQALRSAASDLATAAGEEDHSAATAAMTEVSRSCVACHADYRG